MFQRAILSAILVLIPGVAAPTDRQGASVRAVVSRADLIYKVPVVSSEQGIPIGNGRMGSLVWMTPGALKFQIHRNDVLERNSDHMEGAGFVDLELSGAGADVFTPDATTQHLSVYEGLLHVTTTGVNARLLAWHQRDVIAIEVDDRRPVPEPIQINLQVPRSIRPRDHTADSQITARGGRILLAQSFQQGSHRARSAVAIALLGRRTITQLPNDTEVRIVSPAGRGRVVILMASAATLAADEDVVAAALSNLDAAAVKSFDDLAGDTAEWWHAFWERGALALNSPNRSADHLDDYHYNLYLMASLGGRW